MNDLRLPAEWEEQDGVMLTWPHGKGDWAPHLEQVEPVFAEIARAVTAREQLLVVCQDEHHRIHIARLLQGLPGVHFHVAPSNDTWARDHGPITVSDGEALQLCDFTFDGWGKKYPSELDNRITQQLYRQGAFANLPMNAYRLVLEGGAIESDGEGGLMVTRRCLLSRQRNPGITQQEMESALSRSLGVKRFLWLTEGGLAGDDTDGHIDTLARFCDAGTIAYQSCSDQDNVNFSGLKSMERELRQFRTASGAPYRLVALPSPAPIRNEEGHQLPASYANFLIINGAVLVPVYGDASDAVVLDRLAESFPGRGIVPINCRALILQYGSLHCVTMQLPKGALRR